MEIGVVLKCHSSFLIAVILVVVAVMDVVVDDVGAGSNAIHTREDGAAFGRDPQAHGTGGKSAGTSPRARYGDSSWSRVRQRSPF